MFRWLPDELTILSTALTNYACRTLREVGCWDRLCIVSLVHAERRTLAKGGDGLIYLAAPNRPPHLPWSEFPAGTLLVPPLKQRATDLAKADLVALLTLRGGPLQRCDPRRLNECLESPARAARLGYLCCLQAARREGLSGLAPEDPMPPGRHSVANYLRWRQSALREGTSGRVAEVPDRPYEASAFSKSLTLIALGSLGMQLQHRCEKCFRLAAPSLRRCADHSQSKAVSVDGGKSVHERRAGARAAERIARMIGDIGTTRDLEAAKRSRASQLFGAIFDQPIGDIDEWRGRVRDALQAAPTVQALLPATFDISATRSALRALRRCLDPLECDPWAWPAKIRHADTWLEHYGKAAPGKPPSGPQRKTLERMDTVRMLRAQGLDDETIARKLKVSLRSIQVMFKRHGV